MKNSSDTAFIMMMLCFILASQFQSETGRGALVFCGGVWLAVGAIRTFTQNDK